MPRKKKPRGRPSRPLPPRIDAAPDKIARVMLTTRPKAHWDYEDGIPLRGVPARGPVPGNAVSRREVCGMYDDAGPVATRVLAS